MITFCMGKGKGPSQNNFGVCKLSMLIHPEPLPHLVKTVRKDMSSVARQDDYRSLSEIISGIYMKN